MGKKEQVPVTSNVTEYPEILGDSEKNVFFSQVAGFCQGAQEIKNKNGIHAVRIGALVFISGEFTVAGGLLLPVVPQFDGNFVVSNYFGQVYSVPFVSGSLEVDVSGLPGEVYHVNEFYFARNREVINGN